MKVEAYLCEYKQQTIIKIERAAAVRILKDLKLKLRILKIAQNKNKSWSPPQCYTGTRAIFCVFSIFDAIILMAFRAAFVNKAQQNEIFRAHKDL